MTKKYIKIISLGIKNSLSLENVIKSLMEYGLYFISLVFVFKNIRMFSDYSGAGLNIASAIFLLFIYFYKLFLENVLVFRYLLVSDSFDLILLKPLNPLFRLMLSRIDLVGFAISITMIAGTFSFGNLPNFIPILVSFNFVLAMFIFVLSLLIKTNGNVAFEKLLLMIFPIGLVGVGGVVDGLPILFVSILFIFTAIKFWSYTLSRYVSPNL